MHFTRNSALSCTLIFSSEGLAGFFNLGNTVPYTTSPEYPPLSLWSENWFVEVVDVYD